MQQLQNSKDSLLSDLESTPSDDGAAHQLSEGHPHARQDQLETSELGHVSQTLSQGMSQSHSAHNSHEKASQLQSGNHHQLHTKRRYSGQLEVEMPHTLRKPSIFRQPLQSGMQQPLQTSRSEQDPIGASLTQRRLVHGQQSKTGTRRSELEVQQLDSSQTENTASDVDLDRSLAEGAAGLLAMTSTAGSQDEPQVRKRS